MPGIAHGEGNELVILGIDPNEWANALPSIEEAGVELELFCGPESPLHAMRRAMRTGGIKQRKWEHLAEGLYEAVDTLKLGLGAVAIEGYKPPKVGVGIANPEHNKPQYDRRGDDEEDITVVFTADHPPYLTITRSEMVAKSWPKGTDKNALLALAVIVRYRPLHTTL